MIQILMIIFESTQINFKLKVHLYKFLTLKMYLL